MMLDDMQPGVIPRAGTSLAHALETALRSFEAGGAADRAIVLVTDGEDHEGGTEQVVRALSEARVRVFAVGVGTIAGGTIPAAEGRPGALLRDRSGNVVLTALREDALEKIAVATGGIYVRSSADDSGIERVLSLGISRMRRDEREAKLVKVYEERFPWFLGAAVLLLSLEALLAERGRRREGAAR
jgi:Ca-activated chloride channel family protein